MLNLKVQYAQIFMNVNLFKGFKMFGSALRKSCFWFVHRTQNLRGQGIDLLLPTRTTQLTYAQCR